LVLRNKHINGLLRILTLVLFMGVSSTQAQFLLQAPNGGDESNYRWYEATDTATVLGTDFFYEVTQPGVYFATYDGTLCGSNATGYFIVTNCNSPFNEVTLDISDNVVSGSGVSWSPALSGDQLRPTVIADTNVTTYVATITKAGNSTALPRFTVVCMSQAATLVDDVATVDEDSFVVIPIFDNDSDMMNNGMLTATDPPNGTVTIDDNGTPNDPLDDIVTYTPDPDYNGPDSFDYTLCNALGDCSTATVNIDVLPVLDTLDDLVVTEQDVPVEIDWILNDNDLPSVGTLLTTDPVNGTLAIDNNGTPGNPLDDRIVYIPDLGFQGNDTFEYTICDDVGNCDTAIVTIVVTPPLMSEIDTDNDGIIDSFEDLNTDGDNDPSTNPTDTDGDGIPDYLDIDSDDDGIPDNVEAQTTLGYLPPSGEDENTNGLDDAYEGDGTVGIIPEDTDEDGIPDYVDLDSDNDGIPDNVEGNDFNQDGLPDEIWEDSDKDLDGLNDGYEGDTAIDDDVNDEIDNPLADLPDTDGDGIPDYRDTDDDNDGILTSNEDFDGDGGFTDDDSDEDGIPDYLDPDLGSLGNGLIEVFNAITPNGDGVQDVLRIANIENYPNNNVRIYNRWGVMVYQTRAYNTEGNVFDGTSQGRVTIDRENKLPAGTYFYIIDFEVEGTMVQVSGYLYLNR